MYLRKLMVVVAVLVLSVTATFTFAEFSNSTVQEKTYEQIWNKVEKLSKEGKPKSALKFVGQVKEKALQEENQPQFLKSVFYELQLKQKFMEAPVKEAVEVVRNSFEQTNDKISHAFLHSLLADTYRSYQNRYAYKIRDRTQLMNDTSQDIEQWTNQKLSKEIIDEYQSSLEHEDVLNKTPIEDFKIIIRDSEYQKDYLNTVYDLLASSALDYYTNQDNDLVEAGTALELKDNRYFKITEVFLDISIPQRTNDFAALTLNLYQKLFKFHKDDQSPFLKVMFDLERLQYLKENSKRKDAGELYRFALENLVEQNQNHKVSARVQYKLAEYWNEQGEKYDPQKGKEHKMDKVKAVNYCKKAIEAFPDSYGAKKCKSLKSSLEEKDFSISQENAVIPEEPSIAKVDYRNSPQVFFRIYKLNPDNYPKWNYNRDPNERLKRIKDSELITEWMHELPDDGDLQTHSIEAKIPAMDKGYYMLLASSDKQFNKESTLIKYSGFYATNLQVHVRSLGNNTLEGYVLNRKTGKAIKDAQLDFFKYNYDYHRNNSDKSLIKSLTSGKDGSFQLNAPEDNYNRYALEVKKGEDFFVLPGALYQRRLHKPSKESENINIQLFTDRSIYRPGQIVHFKGLVLNAKGKDSKIKTNYKTTISLFDANNEVVKEKSLTTNEYGSFNGSFVLPSSGLTGRFRLRTSHGSQTIRVEEYKRPRFEVKLQKVDQEFRLGDEVIMRGEAKAYAGSKITNARVSYEVVRKPRYIPWGYTFGYYRPPSSGKSVTIKTGVLETDKNGEFDVKFTAIPGEKAGDRFNSVFRYEVTADVTDINGETRSDSRTVSAGEKALHLDVKIPEKVDQSELMKYKISTTNLDGSEIPAEGTLKIERLQQPERLLKRRAWDRPDKFLFDKQEFTDNFPHEQYKSELDKRKWNPEKEVFQCNFNTAKSDTLTMNCAADWKEGVYKLTMISEDTFGEKVEMEKFFTLYNPETNVMPEKTFFWTEIDKSTAEPGETVNVILGSSAQKANIYFSYGLNGKILDKRKLTVSGEKEKISIPVKEAWRGGFFVYVMMNKEGSLYHKRYKVNVPFSNKKLETQLVTFRDKLKPGSEEEWKIKLKGPEGEKVAAEMLASMYDASLDQFMPHQWSFNYLSGNYSGITIFSSNRRSVQNASYLVYHRKDIRKPKDLSREYLIWEMSKMYSFDRFRGSRANAQEVQMVKDDVAVTYKQPLISKDETGKVTDSAEEQSKEQDSQLVDVRSDFSETAFFYPGLTTNENGEILLSFTMPESVTRWNFMTMSHTKDLKYDLMRKSVQTQKELMVMPNMPRFLRESDTISVSSKISNLTDDTLSGNAELALFNPENMQEISGEFQIENKQQTFEIGDNGNGSVDWTLVVPEGYSAVTWRVTAETKNHSDGEEALLPVLTNRKLVTESMPMSVRSNKTKNYDFDKLLASGASNTLKHHSYTLEVTQNPAWYAVQALPYLAEFPHECSEQIFSRYYANSLASTIANSSPKIKQVFDTWQNIEPDALMSKLEKNEELKSVILSETPWVMDAKNEQEQKRRIAMLFDMNTMSNKKAKALEKLENQQLKSGGWPWFGGDYPNRYITQHIVAGMGHLGALNVADIKKDKRLRKMLKKAIDYMDNEIREDFNRLKENGATLDENNLSKIHVHYLYARSFFMKQFPLEPQDTKSYQYYYGQAQQYWLKQNLYLQGMIALANNRNNDKKQAVNIMESIKDKALYDEEMGMYWRKNNGYYWSQAPVERQALLIEAFDEVLQDKQSVEEMKLWLLKQKQTQNWKTTKATADAVYALLLRGTDLLTTGNSVQITIGDKTIDPETDSSIDTEAGTGYFKKTWTEVAPEMGKVKFDNQGKNVAWGAVYWQYFEQLDKISGHDTPLSLSKELYKEVKTETGRKLEKIDKQTDLSPGDRIKVRVVLSTDRDMEYVHLKDMRASGLEPVNVLSQMKYREGIRYYESTKDAATHFFFDWLPKGKYVFEYPLYVAQKGNFSNGITTVQCMYAPEFSAHSKGIRLDIR